MGSSRCRRQEGVFESIAVLYRLIYAGKVKVLSNLGRLMIPRSEVERLLQQTETYLGKKRPERPVRSVNLGTAISPDR